jgi:uncharacterized protein YdhG (YjbR/CyaY superfamily)
MERSAVKYNTVEEYHSLVPEAIRPRLEELRSILKSALPNAQEIISYNMPAFKQHGVLVYYAACRGHIGFYPTAAPIQVFAKELSAYKTSKGAVQFTLDKPIPKELVKKIAAYRLKEDHEKAALKKQRVKG